jgi:hypothetical protein
MPALSFTRNENAVIVVGKTFYIKEAIKSLGGRWDGHVWTLPLERYSDATRDQLEAAVAAAMKAEKDKKKADVLFARSPEGIAIAQANEKAIIKRMISMGTGYWLCCENARVVNWQRQHTVCEACAQDGNSFRVRGSIYTGD